MLSFAVAICLAASPSASGDQGELLIPPISQPKLRSLASSAAGFAPPGWSVERTQAGDLNRDGETDLVAVLTGADPACMVRTELSPEPMDTNPRLLIVAFGSKQGYRLHLANMAVIPRREDPFVDDPLEEGELAIRGDVVRLRLHHWRSAGSWGTYNNALSFRWDGKAFRLIGFDHHYLQRNSGETERRSVNFLTGRAKIVTGSAQGRTREKVEWKTLRDRSAPTLEAIGNGLEYEPKL